MITSPTYSQHRRSRRRGAVLMMALLALAMITLAAAVMVSGFSAERHLTHQQLTQDRQYTIRQSLTPVAAAWLAENDPAVGMTLELSSPSQSPQQETNDLLKLTLIKINDNIATLHIEHIGESTQSISTIELKIRSDSITPNIKPDH